MTTKTFFKRAQAGPADRVDRVLGNPIAFVLTGVILLSIFGWTFVTNPDRVAPTKDPAYYTWRTEVQISDPPADLLEVTGPFDIFSGGYRVSSSVLGGYLRRIVGVSSLHVTVFLVVALPVLISLLLGGFAYRQRGDPLIFHAVALGAGSLLLTPPFVGYLDNVLCLFFLAAALWFIAPARESWPARVVFGLFLLAAGFTHPTTLVIFFAVLLLMAGARWVYRRFDLKSVIRDDWPAIATALVAIVLTYAIWKIGIWGRSESLSESALPPPYGSDFFLDRMVLWIKAMRPALNGPLFLLGAVGLLAAGRRAAEDELARVSLLWLAPLAGMFGFLAGLTYPYYRFFNTTLAWIVLPGVGIYFILRFFLDRSQGRGGAAAAVVVVAAMAVLIGTNFSTTLKLSGWNNAEGGWLSSQEKTDLDELRRQLGARTDEDTPVVFVVDEEASPEFQIYGFTKLSGNTSRYGLPPEQMNNGYEYLGSLENYLANKPTVHNTAVTNLEDTYNHLSRGFLDYTKEAIADKPEPIVVVASIFNESGSNAHWFEEPLTAEKARAAGDENVWFLDDGGLVDGAGTQLQIVTEAAPEASSTHVLAVIAGLFLLLLPGLLALRFFLPDAGLPEALGMVPALSLTMLALSGIFVLAVTRRPFTTVIAWAALGLAALAGAALTAVHEGLLPGRSPDAAPGE